MSASDGRWRSSPLHAGVAFPDAPHLGFVGGLAVVGQECRGERPGGLLGICFWRGVPEGVAEEIGEGIRGLSLEVLPRGAALPIRLPPASP